LACGGQVELTAEEESIISGYKESEQNQEEQKETPSAPQEKEPFIIGLSSDAEQVTATTSVAIEQKGLFAAVASSFQVFNKCGFSESKSVLINAILFTPRLVKCLFDSAFSRDKF
jgi:hypothetical protein